MVNKHIWEGYNLFTFSYRIVTFLQSCTWVKYYSRLVVNDLIESSWLWVSNRHPCWGMASAFLLTGTFPHLLCLYYCPQANTVKVRDREPTLDKIYQDAYQGICFLTLTCTVRTFLKRLSDPRANMHFNNLTWVTQTQKNKDSQRKDSNYRLNALSLAYILLYHMSIFPVQSIVLPKTGINHDVDTSG